MTKTGSAGGFADGAAGEWRVTLGGGALECGALLFASGTAFGLHFRGRCADELWQDREEKQATLRQAKPDSGGRYERGDGPAGVRLPRVRPHGAV